MNNEIVIRNLDPQEITINEGGTVTGITNVYVNGTDVTIGTKAYVIVPTKLSELTNDEGFITNAEETDPTVPSYVKAITQADINSWNSKQDQLVSTQNIKSINGNSILGSGNLNITNEYEAGNGIDISDNIISNTITSYNDLTDTPIIPTKTSDLVNDSGYITKDVNDLENYYNIEFLTKLLPMSEDSGTELYLVDTVEAPLRIDLNPHEITQHTTTGKNLLPFDRDTIKTYNTLGTWSDYSYSYNGITYVLNEDGSVSLSGTTTGVSYLNLYYSMTRNLLTDTELYKFSKGIVNTKIFLAINENIGGSWVAKVYANGQEASYTPTGTQDGQLFRILVENGNTVDPATTYPMIVKGATVGSYEEYTGGEPSPNPGYPQTLHTVTGENTITVKGKNLYNPSYRNSSNNIYMVNGTATESNGVFTLTATGNDMYMWQIKTLGNSYDPNAQGQLFTLTDDDYTITISNHTMTANYITFYDKDKVSLGYISFGGSYTKTFNISDVNVPDDSKYFSLRVGYASATVGTSYSFTVQIEKGSTSTTYVPFESESYLINLFNVDNPYTGTTDDFDLVKITTNRDVYETFFFKNYKDSKYYISGASEDTIWYNIGVYKYESNPNDAWYKEDLYGGGFQFSLNIPNLYAGGYSKVRSNYFTDITEVNDPDNESCIFAILNILSIRFNSSYNINTIEDFITWITNNPFTAYIARSGTSPEYQVDRLIDNWPDLAVQYKNVMNEATAYNEATNITQDNYDLPYELKGKTFKKLS